MCIVSPSFHARKRKTNEPKRRRKMFVILHTSMHLSLIQSCHSSSRQKRYQRKTSQESLSHILIAPFISSENRAKQRSNAPANRNKKQMISWTPRMRPNDNSKLNYPLNKNANCCTPSFPTDLLAPSSRAASTSSFFWRWSSMIRSSTVLWIKIRWTSTDFCWPIR